MAYETTDQLLTLPSHHWYKEHDGNLYKLLNVFNGDLERISDSGDKVAKWRGIFDAKVRRWIFLVKILKLTDRLRMILLIDF